jgi:hypothetical protein
MCCDLQRIARTHQTLKMRRFSRRGNSPGIKIHNRNCNNGVLKANNTLKKILNFEVYLFMKHRFLLVCKNSPSQWKKLEYIQQIWPLSPPSITLPVCLEIHNLSSSAVSICIKMSLFPWFIRCLLIWLLGFSGIYSKSVGGGGGS